MRAPSGKKKQEPGLQAQEGRGGLGSAGMGWTGGRSCCLRASGAAGLQLTRPPPLPPSLLPSS